MMLAAVLIDTLHSAFEDGEKAFDGIGVNGWVNLGHVFALTMTSKRMAGEVLIHMLVLASLVGHDSCLAGDVFLQGREQGLGFEVIHDHAPSLAAGAIHQGENLVLVIVTTPLLLTLWFLGVVMANKGFIQFDSAATRTKG